MTPAENKQTFGQWLSALSPKKILTAILIVIALFIPTYIAIANYQVEKNNPLKAVTAVTLTDPAGNCYTFDGSGAEGEIDGNTAAYFLALKNTASPQSNLPEQLVGTDHYTVVYSTYEKEITETYYFSKDPSDCYFVDGDGKAWRLKADDAQKFVLSSYASGLYQAAAAPTLTLAGDKAVLPQSMIWKYLSYNNEYISEPQNTSEEVDTFLMVGGIDLAFSVEPDYLSVSILDKNDTLIWSGNYNDISEADLKEGQTYLIKADAKWHENIKRGAFGDATYQFCAKIKAAASFRLETTELEPGEFTVITGENVDDLNDIKFYSTPSIEYTPTFYRDGDFVRALIPISIFIEEPAEKYEFTVTCGATTQKMTLKMIDKTFRSQTSEIEKSIINQHRTAATLKAFTDTVSPYLSAHSEQKYFGAEAFLEAVADRSVKSGFGIIRTLKNSGETYRHEGVDYVVYKNDTVQAIAPGKVIYIGDTVLSGKTVIVDHGLGLKSLYAHLSDISVKVGDTLQAADAIGIVGDTGFTSGSSLHAGLYVYNVPVCPYDLWETGIVMKQN